MGHHEEGLGPAAVPVHWLRDAAALRAYRAQNEHCQELYDRARRKGFSGPTESARPWKGSQPAKRPGDGPATDPR